MPQMLIGIAVFMGVALMVILFFFPGESRRIKQKKEKLPEEEKKDWEAISLKLEKHIQSLRKETEGLKINENKLKRDLSVEKARNAKLQEKIKLENEWLAKEEVTLAKKDEEIRLLKESLMKAQQELENEYASKLRVVQENKDLKSSFDQVNNEKKEFMAKSLSLQAEIERAKKDIEKLKALHEELKKKTDETNWVSKAEYTRLEKLVRDKDEEIRKMRFH